MMFFVKYLMYLRTTQSRYIIKLKISHYYIILSVLCNVITRECDKQEIKSGQN